jgi:hypothetical protein
MSNATAPLVTIAEFLNARLDEDESEAGLEKYEAWWVAGGSPFDPDRVRREIAAKRAVIEFHKQWPVLVETPPKLDRTDDGGLDSATFRMSRQIMWATEQEYRKRFGDEPPTTPIMRALASVYSDHPDYREEWKP